jgi:hypothetical protein
LGRRCAAAPEHLPNRFVKKANYPGISQQPSLINQKCSVIERSLSDFVTIK